VFEASAAASRITNSEQEEEGHTCCFGLGDLSLDTITIGRVNLTGQLQYIDATSRTIAKIVFPKATVGPLSLILSLDPSPRDVSIDLACDSLSTTWLVGPPGDLRFPSPHIPPPVFPPDCPRLAIRVSADSPRVEVRAYFNQPTPQVEVVAEEEGSYNRAYIAVGVILLLYITFHLYRSVKKQKKEKKKEDSGEEEEKEKSLDV
jgi:hypothetical protein